KSSIQSKIADRTAYLHKVRHEIASLQAEAQRQAQLAAQQARQTIANYSSTPAVQLPTNYTPPTGSVPASAVGTSVVRAAMTRLGDQYVWATAGPSTFDCSGLVVWAYAQVNISLPHYTYDQMSTGTPVSSSDLAPGDLVFFYGGAHVGIYIGGGQFIHAPHPGTVVQVASLSSYSGAYYTARRIA
ncbi:MAG: C40 family peptidase, partial [Gaiellaceae bacterium]